MDTLAIDQTNLVAQKHVNTMIPVRNNATARYLMRSTKGV